MSEQTFDRVVDWSVNSQDDREYAYVPVTVWKANARVQTLNAKELTDLLDIGGDNIGFKLMALCVVDEQGQQVFRGADEQAIEIKALSLVDPSHPTGAISTSLTAAIDRVKQRNPKAINQLAEALIAINGVTVGAAKAKEQAEEQKNDSGETPTDVSPIA